MKFLFPVVLAAGWITMVAFTMSDFANFYAAVHAHDLPVIQATETIIVTGKPKKRAAKRPRHNITVLRLISSCRALALSD